MEQLPFQDDRGLPASTDTGVLRRGSRLYRRALPLGAACVLGACTWVACRTPAAPAASTTQDTASFAVIGGPLQLELGAPRLAPGVHAISLQLPFAVTDARGTGAGWSVSASFVSVHARASVTSASVGSIGASTGLAAQSSPLAAATAPLPDHLTALAQPVLDVAPGAGGMGRFAGQLAVSVVPDGQQQIGGRLTLTLSSAP